MKGAKKVSQQGIDYLRKKLNQALPGYITADVLRDLTGIKGG